ncbi:hypothetical protein RCL1_000549 [Eukaryota sp. TZLM3-RCL]
MGPFPRDDEENRFLFVIVDSCSRFCILGKAKTINAQEVAKFLLKEVFCMFGLPQEIHSDRGPEFNNDVLKKLFELLAIEQSFSVPHHHQSNGMVERKNRDVLSLLRKLLLTYQSYNSWSSLVPLIQVILNSSVNSITGCTPSSLLFGSDILEALSQIDKVLAITYDYCDVV